MSVSTRYKTALFMTGAAMLSLMASASPLGLKPPENVCCDAPKQHNVTIPGFHVAPPSVAVTSPGVRVNPGHIGSGGQHVLGSGIVVHGQSDTVIVGGGGGVFGTPGVAPSAIAALNVNGAGETVRQMVTEQVPVSQDVCIDQPTTVPVQKAVQAVCLDDTGTPHPASRVDAANAVPAHYAGEVFRCMAGTVMQVTVGVTDDAMSSTAQGRAFSCAKGDALYHTPGGELSCRPQMPERNCNERSLLRRYGPGTKLVTSQHQAACVPTTRTVMQNVTREVETIRQAAPAPIVFDGGVGQGVF